MSALPTGWFDDDARDIAARAAEYERELPDEHPLAGVPVKVIAYRKGTDDILVRHTNAPDTVSVVHLSWARKRELPNHPVVEFTGSFAGFVEWEYETYGVR